MSVRLFASLVLVFATSVVVGDDAKQDLDKLKGTWHVGSFEIGGQKMPAEMTDQVTFTFEGDKLKVAGIPSPDGEPGREFTLKLDPSSKPRSIDMTALNGERKGKVAKGIYEINGDELKLCMPNDENSERPRDFQPPKESRLALVMLKRKK